MQKTDPQERRIPQADAKATTDRSRQAAASVDAMKDRIHDLARRK